MAFIVTTSKIESSTKQWGGIMDNMSVYSKVDLVSLMERFNATDEQISEVCQMVKYDHAKICQTEWKDWTVFIQVKVVN